MKRWAIIANRPVGGTAREYRLGPFRWLVAARIRSLVEVLLYPLAETEIRVLIPDFTPPIPKEATTHAGTHP